jgi:hypothetical protein
MLTGAKSRSATEPRPTIGWRERVSMPALGIGPIIAKVDTGAKWCALHAEEIHDRGKYVEFKVAVDGHEVSCRVRVYDRREITSSSGHKSKRPMIKTEIVVGEFRFPAEVTLADRRDLQVPMLIGRKFLLDRFLVNAARSFLLSKTRRKKKRKKASP